MNAEIRKHKKNTKTLRVENYVKFDGIDWFVPNIPYSISTQQNSDCR